ncbi:MAG: hypothetical protein ACYC0F_16420, partial [Rhodanobacter sp.]
MVAVISGNGLGLGNTSLTQLGQAQGGTASLGQAGNTAYVNGATGNLILQGMDEGLIFDGLQLNALRTYNSLGELNGQADWRYGFSRSIGGLTGTLNTAGSTITRTGDDGSAVVYTYDADRGAYVSSGQSGPEDSLSWNAGSNAWTYTDAADQIQETYDANGRLSTLTNTATGASYSFSYSNGQLSQIVAGDGDTLIFDYNTAGQLSDLEIQEIPPGQSVAVTRQAVSYDYDTQGRLTSVTTNLASDTDPVGGSYTTSYTYDGSSDRIASVTQSDGTTVSYGYTLDAQGTWQVTSITTGSGADAQTVTLSYDDGSLVVTDPMGRRTVYLIDGSGRLTMMLSPPINGTLISTLYTYDDNGNLLTLTNADTGVSRYEYDDQGNMISYANGSQERVDYTYDAEDQMVSRTVFAVSADGTPGISGYVPASGPQTSYNIYDAQGRLTYTVDALGNVTAYTYMEQGGTSLLASRQQLIGVSYDLGGATPDTPPTLAQLNAWIASAPVQQSLGRAVRTDYSYDPRGQLSQQIQWSRLDTNGEGSLATDASAIVTTYTYDAQGRLLQAGTLRGTDRSTLQSTSYSYDGLGRLLSSTDALGNTTSYAYTDSTNQIAVTLANGLTTVQVRNSAGLLLSSTVSGDGMVAREADYLYNAAGQQVATIDPAGHATYIFYDGFGRIIGTVDPNGGVTAYQLDKTGQIVRTTQYATRIDTAGWIADGNLAAGFPAVLPIPTSTANDVVTRTMYDSIGQVVATLAADNTITVYTYDGTGNVTSTRSYATLLSESAVEEIWSYASNLQLLVPGIIPASPDDRVVLTIYDADERPVATIDSAGTVRAVNYDSLGNVIASATYKTTLTADQLAQLEASRNMTTLRILLGSTVQTIYDAQNHPVATIDANGKVTVNTYDAAGKLVAAQAFATALTPDQVIQLGAAPTLAAIVADVTPSAGDQTTLTIYDVAEHPLATVAADGSVTTTIYDANGNAVAHTVYATALTVSDMASLGLTPSFAQLQAVLHPGAGDQTALTIYDANNQPVASVAPDGHVTVIAYDAAGRVTASTIYATALDATQLANLGTAPTLTDLQADLTTSSSDQTTLTVYDANGHVVGAVDAQGNVTITRYDAQGNIAGSTQYATPLSDTAVAALGTAPTLEQLQAAVIAGSGDQVSVTVRDDLDGLVATVGADGSVQLDAYDAAGHLLASSQLAQTLSAMQLAVLGSSPDWATLQNYLAQGEGALDALTVTDSQGRAVITVSADGHVTTSSYDAAGHQTSWITYYQPLNANQAAQLAANPTLATLQGLVSPNNNDSAGLNFYDDAGRNVANFSPWGAFTAGYDSAGRVTSQVSYSNRPTAIQIESLGSTPTLQEAESLLIPSVNDAASATIYDANGNAVAVIDRYQTTINAYDDQNNLVQTEEYGNPLTAIQIEVLGPTPSMAQLQAMYGVQPTASVTNIYADGGLVASISPANIYDPVLGGYAQGGLVTTYEYDAAGNLVAEHGYGLTHTQMQSVGDPPQWSVLQPILQPMSYSITGLNIYDASNNKLASVNDNGEVEIYSYDAAGNQTETIQYAQDIDQGEFQSLGDSPTLQQLMSLLAPSPDDDVELSIYDANGNVAASIDNDGVVTRYEYDADGNQVGSIQYADVLFRSQVLALGGAPSVSQLMAVVKPRSDDQVDLTIYDAEGNWIRSIENGEVDVAIYGANGDDYQERHYAQHLTPEQMATLGTTPTLAALDAMLVPSFNDTIDAHFYDDNGNPLAELDTDGSITIYNYDVAGNLLNSKTYSNALNAQQVSALGFPVTLAALQSAVAPLGEVPNASTNLYGADGRLAATVDEYGTVVIFRYDDSQNSVVQQTYTHALNPEQLGELGDTPSLAMLELDLGLASGGSLSQTLYDTQGRVIATVSDAGQVTTTTYDAAGHVTSTTQYATPLPDGRGYMANIEQLLEAVTVSPEDVTSRTIYDASGRVAATIDPTGLVSVNSYDAQGNLVAVTGYTQTLTAMQMAKLGDAPTLSQVEALVDPTARTIYNAANQPVVTIDQEGRASYAFYDDAGRLSLSIDAGGDATAYVYDANGNAIQTTRYATPVDTSGWLTDGTLSAAYPTTAPIPASSTADRVSTSVYNAVGELVATIDPAGNVTTLRYDAFGDVLEQTSYATPLTTQQRANLGGAPSLNDLLGAVTTNSNDRSTRLIYDSLGNVVASVDAAGYVLTTAYDGDNRAVLTTAYATALDAGQIAELSDTSTLADLQAMLAASPHDEQTRFYYDASGRPAAQIDAAGDLTVFSYDIGTDTTTTTRYAEALTATQLGALDGSERVADLVDDLGSNLDSEQSSVTYDAFGQVASRTDVDGTVTSYIYDGAGRVLSTTVTPASGQGAPRTTSSTYDSQGNLLTVTDANGGVTSYEYNAAGQRTKATDADGNSSWYYYDGAGRLACVIEGEPADPDELNVYANVTAYAYDAFGEITHTTRYSSRLFLTNTVAGGTGTLNPDIATMQSVAAAIATLGGGVSTGATYTADGQVATTTDADGYHTRNSYDAFGDLVQTQVQLGQAGQALSPGNSTITGYSFDNRGLLVGETDGFASAVQRDTSVSYDAFGNRVQTIDGNGDSTAYTYDALNRQTGTTRTVQGTVRGAQVAYDAFNRVLTRTDALGRTTTYSYDLASHRITVTSPDGVVMTTIKDAFGDTVSTADSAGNTISYAYDNKGNLLTTADALGNTRINVYDAVGNLIQTTDATGHVVAYTYDADRRVTTQVVDPSGLDEESDYYYDGQGNLVEVDDPLGTVTLNSYDGDGNLVLQVRDAGTAGQAINATTRYTYDGTGDVLTVTQGDGSPQASTTQYVYDAIGQLSEKTVDPDGLALTTSYAYDAGGNNVAVTDPNGNTAYAIYDEAGEVVYTIAPVGAPNSGQGAVTSHVYDADGHLIGTTAYVTAVSTASLDALAAQAPAANLQVGAQLVAGIAGSANPASYVVYNGDGQQVYRIDPRGFVTETRYNALGQVAQTLAYSNAITVDDSLAQVLAGGGDVSAQMQGALTAAGDSDSSARVNYLYYDADGRAVYSATPTLVNGQPGVVVSGTTYDEAGRVVATSVYGQPLSLSDVGGDADAGSIAAVLAAANNASTTRTAQYVFDNAGNQIQRIDPNGVISYQVYDEDNRLIGTVDGTGAAVAYERDDLGRVVFQTSYYRAIPSDQLPVEGVPLDASQFNQLIDGDEWDDRVVATTYDGLGRVATVTHYAIMDGSGSHEREAADFPDDVDEDFYSSGDTITYTYDAASRLLASIDDDRSGTENSREIDYYYDNNGNVIGKLDASRYLTTYSYDAANRLTQTTAYATASQPGSSLASLIPASSPGDQVTRQFYDALGNCVGVLDADGYFTQYSFDLGGNQASSLRYATLVPTADQGSLASIQAFVNGTAGESTSDTYDAYGELASQTDPSGTVTSYGYDTMGNLLQTTVAGGTADARTSGATYDAFGNVSRSTDGLGNATTYAYDLAGNRTSMTDALGNTIWYVYDAANRLNYTIRGETDGSGLQNGLGEVTQNIHDTFGEIVEARNFATLATLPSGFAPDMDTMQDIVDTIGGQVENDADQDIGYTYDMEGNVVEKYDGNENRTQYVYDGFNQLIESEEGFQGEQAFYTYDASGNLTSKAEYNSPYSSCGSGGEAVLREQDWTYDAFGHIATYVDGNGSTTSYAYDNLGRQTSQSLAVQGTVRETHRSYDGYGRVISTTDAMGLVTTYAYDDATRSLTVTAPGGHATTTLFNREGQQIAVTDTAGRTTAYQYDADGRLAQTTQADGGVATVQYDADGNATLATDAAGHAVAYSFDAAGRVLTQTVDPDGLALATTYQYDGRGLAVQVTDPTGASTTYAYDGNGNMTYSTSQIGSGDNVYTVTTNNDYDLHDKLTQSYVTSNDPSELYEHDDYYSYNALGEMTYAQTSTGKTWETRYAYDADGNVVSKTDGNGVITYYAYNEADELVYTVTPMGGSGEAWEDNYVPPTGVVTQNWYNADGQLIGTCQYASAISSDDMATYVLSGQDWDSVALVPSLEDIAALVQPGVDDRTTYRVYGPDSQLQYGIDATGTVTEYRYNAAGQPWQTLVHGRAINVSPALADALQAGTATASDVQLALAQVDDAGITPRSTYAYYDAMGNVRYTVTLAVINGQSGGIVTAYDYDADGNAIEETQYGQPVPASQLGATSSTDSIAAFLAGATDTHVTHNVYDAAGRLVYTINPAGCVTELQYDGDGRTTWTLQYANAIGTPASWNQVDVAAAVAAANTDPSTVHGTGSVYDLAGRLIQTLDKLSGTPVATYTYDAVGEKTSYTDRDGQTWTYKYNVVGNLTLETGPSVTVMGYGQGGGAQNIETSYLYDLDGNLVSQIDNANTEASRETDFVYDSSGKLLQTLLPPAGALSPGQGLASMGDGASLDTTYNVFGDAVVSKDANGNYAYDVYDADDRLVYAIDRNGYATGYTYDAFGQQTGVTRYAVPLDIGSLADAGDGWQEGQPIDLTQLQSLLSTSPDDRTLTTAYDLQGNKISVTQPAITYTLDSGSTASGSPQVSYTYDAYGNVTSQSVLVQGTPGQADAVWATTYHYYDALGRQMMTVDPMGYVTTNSYDAFGNITSTTEWATAIATAGLTAGGAMPNDPQAGNAATGLDRTTQYTYDVDGRKASESVQRTYVNAQGQTVTGFVTTAYGYDGEGRITTVTTDGRTIATAYDALGRVTSVTGPAQPVLVDNWQQLLEANPGWDLTNSALYTTASQVVSYAYDAFGNKLMQSVGSTASDSVSNTFYMYDQRGNMVASIDAGSQQQVDWNDPDILGNPGVTTYTYDDNGNLLSTRSILEGNDTSSTVVVTSNTYDADDRLIATVTQRVGAALPDKSAATTYDAFGGVVATGDGVTDGVTQLYDNAGNLVGATDPKTGVQHAYAYNLAGQRVSDVWAGTATTYALDLDGRAVSELGPSTTAATGQGSAPVTATYDRWGNVLTSTDARGGVTTYTYNERNQLATQAGPTVTVVGIDGTATATAPTRTIGYDDNGNAAIVTDENGNVTRTRFNAIGQIVSVTDGANATSHTAYDALGNEAADQDGNGHIAFKDYDSLGNVVVQGDFTLSADGLSRQLVWRQAYVVDQSGNRLISYDGIGSAYLQGGDTADAALHANYDGYDSQGRVLWSQDAAQRAASVSDEHGATAGTWTQAPTNANFGEGLTGWVGSANWSAGNFGSGPYGPWTLSYGGTSDYNGETLVNQDRVPVVPGQTITAYGSFVVNSEHGGGSVQIVWYDASGNYLSTSFDIPNQVTAGNGPGQVSQTGTAPPGAAYAAIAVGAINYQLGGNSVYCTGVSWDYVPPAGATSTGANGSVIVWLPGGSFTQQPANPDFENGDTDWTKGDGWSIIAGGYNGSGGSAQLDFTGSTTSTLTNSNQVPVTAGQTITASAMIQQGASDVGQTGGAVQILWYDANGNFLSASTGNYVIDGRHGAWHPSRVTAAAPAGAAYASVAINGWNHTNDPLWADAVSWNYQYIPTAPTGVVQNTYVYDLDGQLVSQTTADGDTETWQYDAYGRVVGHTDLSGAVYHYTYDADTGLLTGESDNWSPTAQGQSTPAYVTAPITTPNSSTDTYFADGQLATQTYADGSAYSYSYDANGNQVRQEATTVDGNGQAVHTVTTTTYDSHNRLSHVVATNVLTGA